MKQLLFTNEKLIQGSVLENVDIVNLSETYFLGTFVDLNCIQATLKSKH